MTVTAADMRRLKWSCRRGLLELDVLLERFLNQKYADLSIEQQAVFKQLLACTDQELLSWLMGNAQPQDENLQKMVVLISSDKR